MDKDNDQRDEFMEKLAELPYEGRVIMEASLNALLLSSRIREGKRQDCETPVA